MDKMEGEWESVLLEIVPYKETGTFIMKSGDETAQMLDDHIVMAQAMSFSPYKKPFELRITTWETKLRLIQVSNNTRSTCVCVCFLWFVLTVCQLFCVCMYEG